MDLDPNDLLIYARVVEAGSMSRAADRLGLPKSTVSRRVTALEDRLGERLLTRTTRKLVVTDFGTGVLEHARRLAEEVDQAAALAQHRQAEPSGRLRISMPGDFASLFIAGLLADYSARYPAVTLELDLSPRRVDLVGENFDLALRMGDLPDDATLAARRVADFSIGLYAAPSYLARHGQPGSPQDLSSHQILGLTVGDAARWTLAKGKARFELALPARLAANSPELLVRLVCLGAGIAAAPDLNASPYLTRGELVRVLPEWSLPAVTCWAVFPGRRLMPAKTRAFLDMLQAVCREGSGCAPG